MIAVAEGGCPSMMLATFTRNSRLQLIKIEARPAAKMANNNSPKAKVVAGRTSPTLVTWAPAALRHITLWLNASRRGFAHLATA
jgi:hypothetical protein